MGTALIGQALGLLLGARLHAELPEGLRTDQVAGGVFGVVGVLVALWILLPTLSARPRLDGRASARHASPARSPTFPNPPDTLEALRNIVGDDPFPEVFDALRPAPDVGTTPGDSGLSAEMEAAVTSSTVKVEGEACGRIQEGSGFFVTPHLVVTNAHVVAGEDDTELELAGGDTVDATVVAFDPQRDLAVLRTADRASALPLRAASRATRAACSAIPGAATRDQPVPGGRSRSRPSAQHLRPGPDPARCSCWRRSWPRGTRAARWSTPRAGRWGWPSRCADKPGVAYALAIEAPSVLNGDLSRPQDTGNCLV